MQFLSESNRRQFGLLLGTAFFLILTAMNMVIKAAEDSTSVFQLTSEDCRVETEENEVISFEGEEEDYTILKGGDYILTGTLNGSLIIEAEEDENVHLFLNQIEINAQHGPAIWVKNAGKVILTFEERTENTFQDSPYYPSEQDVDACIYSGSDLTFNGSGSARIYGFYKNAVHTKDAAKILCRDIYLKAKKDGIKGNDGILVQAEKCQIECEKNGLHTTKTSKKTSGMIELRSGEVNILAGEYAIDSAMDIIAIETRLFLKGILGNTHAAGEIQISEEYTE